jgi:hypothetical protein
MVTSATVGGTNAATVVFTVDDDEPGRFLPPALP